MTRNRAAVWSFVVAAYLLTWMTVSPLVASGTGDGSAPSWLHALGALGPTIAAISVVAWSAGESLSAERRRMLHWRGLGRRVWLWALTPISFALFGLAVTALTAGLPTAQDLARDPLVDEGAWIWMLVVPALAFGVFEEPGWRGFLLPRLQATHTAAGATWRLWLIWAGWHTPFFFYRYDPLAIPAVIGTMYFGAVWLTGLTNTAGGSVLPAIVWHVLYDLAVIVPERMPSIYPVATSIPVVLAAIWMGRRYGGEDLSDRRRVSVPAPDSRQRTPPGERNSMPLARRGRGDEPGRVRGSG